MFSKRLSKVINDNYKNQRVASKDLGVTESFLSRHMNSSIDPEVVVFLNTIVTKHKITPEKLYLLITGNNVEQTEKEIEDIAFFKEQNRKLTDAVQKLATKISENGEATHQETQGQRVTISGNVGKNRKHTSTAPP